MAARCTTPESGVDGVDILAVLEHKRSPEQGEKKVVLVLQYRPPMENLSLEFPAGLIDAGESATEAAERELFEETYGRTGSESDPLYCDYLHLHVLCHQY